ncbi:transglutaminase-like domain-containing protein [Alicyclobacillus suci]|uniref:transglutaminase-like domain-containing protein n=1 Tax=Alicyclobacillus suci TaxID=2816080 RepID=UPI001A8F6D91|nr:transglutaminase-like domain-containing protein [Alicyclobacillus suci]
MRRFRHTKTIERTVHALLCAVWLESFFGPVANLGLLNGPKTFLFPLLVFVAAAIVHRWWAHVLGALIACYGYVVYFWRPDEDSLGFSLIHMPAILVRQAVAAVRGGGLQDPLQTCLFVCGLAVVFWLVTYASYRLRLWMFYNVLALVVLGAIDGNTNVHPNVALVVVSIIFLAILGLNQLRRVRAFAADKSRVDIRFYTPVLGLLALCLLVGFTTPKSPAVWPNPFHRTASGGGTGVQTIGYQLDNSHLGGSFVTNNTPVLAVESPYPTYLRGQTLTDYTGKGWVSYAPLTDAQMAEQTVGQKISGVEGYTFHDLPTVSFDETITVQSDSVDTSDLFGGYRIDNVLSLPGAYHGAFSVDHVQGNIHAPKLRKGQTYQVKVEELRAPYEELAKDTTSVARVASQAPRNIQDADLELPASLPTDVKTLAQQVVAQAGAKTEYAAVSALMEYLQDNYTYQTSGVPVPGPHQDYVAQFLFQSKVGYCNNFSSALAVMLRTLGVPTRWVTGYAAGTPDYGNSSANLNSYTITNDDAHSWVEVYFPTYGWIPFDPTPNFQMPFAAPKDAGSTTPDSSTSAPTPAKPQVPPQHPEQPDVQQGGQGGNGLRIVIVVGRVALWVAVGVGVAAAVVLMVWRRRMLYARLERQWGRDPLRTFARVYALLLRALRRRYQLKQSLTVRELWPFAARVGIAEEEYQTFVQTVERVLYGGGEISGLDAATMQQTSMKWLRLLYQSKSRHKSPIDDIEPHR